MIEAYFIDSEKRQIKAVRIEKLYEAFCEALNCEDCNSYYTGKSLLVFDADAAIKNETEWIGSFKIATQHRVAGLGLVEERYPFLNNAFLVGLDDKAIANVMDAINGQTIQVPTFDKLVTSLKSAREILSDVKKTINFQSIELYRRMKNGVIEILDDEEE